MQSTSVVLVLGCLALLPAVAAADDGAGMEALSWIAGRWEGQAFGGKVDEYWAPPAGGSMMGLFRLVRDGKTSLFEFLVIEREEQGIVYRFKHFSPGYKAWEKVPLAFRLVRADDSEAVFESPDKGQKPARLTYRRTEDDGLVVHVESFADGEVEAFDVRMRRVGVTSP